jgi:hypothetical protein
MLKAPIYVSQNVSPCDSTYSLQRKFLLDEEDIARLTRPPLQQQQQLGASAASGL